MQATRNVFFMLLLVFPIWGCATGGPPADTSNKKLAAAVVQLEGFAKTVKYAAERGMIPRERAGEVKAALLSAQISLDVWRRAPDDLTAGSNALAALRVMQLVLDSMATVIKPLEGPPT